MKRLHISFKLALASFFVAVLGGVASMFQLQRIYSLVSLVGPVESNQQNEQILDEVSRNVKILTPLILVMVIVHIVCLCWGIIHEVRKR